jgi:hypothetical protein
MREVGSWHDSEVSALFAYVGYRSKSGHAVDITAMTEFDPKGDVDTTSVQLEYFPEQSLHGILRLTGGIG